MYSFEKSSVPTTEIDTDTAGQQGAFDQDPFEDEPDVKDGFDIDNPDDEDPFDKPDSDQLAEFGEEELTVNLNPVDLDPTPKDLTDDEDDDEVSPDDSLETDDDDLNNLSDTEEEEDLDEQEDFDEQSDVDEQNAAEELTEETDEVDDSEYFYEELEDEPAVIPGNDGSSTDDLEATYYDEDGNEVDGDNSYDDPLPDNPFRESFVADDPHFEYIDDTPADDDVISLPSVDQFDVFGETEEGNDFLDMVDSSLQTSMNNPAFAFFDDGIGFFDPFGIMDFP